MAKVCAIEPGDGEEQQTALRLMLQELDNGRRVIVGTYKELEPGEWIAGSNQRNLVVKRRATREEFLLAVPPFAVAGDPGPPAPFYFELEEWSN